MSVAVRTVGVDGGHLNSGFDGGQLEWLGHRHDRSEVLELAADLAHHEVSSDETDLAVGSIDVPDARLEVRQGAHVNAPNVWRFRLICVGSRSVQNDSTGSLFFN